MGRRRFLDVIVGLATLVIAGALASMLDIWVSEPVAPPLLMILASLIVVERVHWLIAGSSRRSTLLTRLQSSSGVVFFHLAVFAILYVSGWGSLEVGESSSAERTATALVRLLPIGFYHAAWLVHRQRWLRRFGNRAWTWRHYLDLNFRALAAAYLLVCVLPAVQDFASAWPSAFEWLLRVPYAAASIPVALVVGLTALAPMLVRCVLPKDAEYGSRVLRGDRDPHAASSLPVHVFESDGNIVNAAMVGLVPPIRMIVVSDGLIARFPSQQIDAVLAHETGHARCHHAIVAVSIIAAVQVVAVYLALRLERAWTTPYLQYLEGAILLGALLYFYPRLARRFEHEADYYAVSVQGSSAPMISTLATLGYLYPTRRKKGGLLHPSLDDRIAFLLRCGNDAEFARRFERLTSRLKFATMGAATMVIFAGILVTEAETDIALWPDRVALASRNRDLDWARQLKSLSLDSRSMTRQDFVEAALDLDILLLEEPMQRSGVPEATALLENVRDRLAASPPSDATRRAYAAVQSMLRRRGPESWAEQWAKDPELVPHMR